MTTDIHLIVLGCGSSAGSPMIGCDCATCTSSNPKNQRTRCSAYLNIGSQAWQIDTGTDFRTQALREHLSHIDGVLYTHPHADHLNGIDDLRAFCYQQQAAIPVYGNHFTIANIQTRFDYALNPPSQHWNRPVLATHILPLNQGSEPVLHIDNVPVWHFGVPHGHWTTSAYRIGNIAWFTDLNDISDDILACLQGLDYLFLDCLMDTAYPSHLSTAQAFDFARRIAARHTFFLHLNHSQEYEHLKQHCPPQCAPAFDGLHITSCY